MTSVGLIAATLRPMAQSIPKFSFPAVAPTTHIKTSLLDAYFRGLVVHSRTTGWLFPNSPALTNTSPSPEKLLADPGGACPISKVAISPSFVSAHPTGNSRSSITPTLPPLPPARSGSLEDPPAPPPAHPSPPEPARPVPAAQKHLQPIHPATRPDRGCRHGRQSPHG